MAEETTVLKTFLSCQLCWETFKEPVSLGCNHNFCSSCLQDFWDQVKNKNCPTCKRKSSKDASRVNFGLQLLADDYAGRQRADPTESRAVCNHTQDLKWCKEEQRVVCHVCECQHVHGLTLVPLEDEVHNLKVLLKSKLLSLKGKINKYQDIEDTYDNMAQHCKKQLETAERQIKAEFDQIHRFLNKEEDDRLAALREEEEQKRETITLEKNNIQAQISALSDVISAVEQDLLLKDNLAFLTSYKRLKTSPRDLGSESGPQLLPRGLVDVAKHLGNLSFRVWEKMRQEIIKFTPVIFDPNTASDHLVISDDLTSVRNQTLPRQDNPDNPERFTQYSNVLGYEGFTSGTHSWEVEVGDHPQWLIGVTEETVDRKGGIYPSPENGFWCLFHQKGGYSNGSGQNLNLKRNPERIRVVLDCGRGKVSFSDPQGNVPIYTFRGTFSEKIYPFFSVQAQTIDVKVCDVKIDVNVK